MKDHSLQQRAIRGAWQVARKGGIAGDPGGPMNADRAVRACMVRAWLAGYRQGKAAPQDQARARAGGAL